MPTGGAGRGRKVACGIGGKVPCGTTLTGGAMGGMVVVGMGGSEAARAVELLVGGGVAMSLCGATVASIEAESVGGGG